MLRPALLALTTSLALAACSPTGLDEVAEVALPPAVAAPAAEPSPSPSPLLSVRRDAAGKPVLTPELLRDRRVPTISRLAPPPDGRFASSIGPITPELRARMGESWSPACPVDLSDLRYVTVAFRGFDGLAHTGELVLAEDVAEDVVGVFRQLFDAGFPIEEMRLVTTEDHHAPKTGDGNSTAAYNCRVIRGGRSWSEHALGTAVDINPFHNPMYKRGTVTPEKATAYVDRTNVRPGMVVDPGVAVRAFAAIGWKWGGHWSSHQDWMHFSATGR